jgi:hypothetical protein
MDAVVAGQILAGVVALILLRGVARGRPAPAPVLVPARVRPVPRRRVYREDE